MVPDRPSWRRRRPIPTGWQDAELHHGQEALRLPWATSTPCWTTGLSVECPIDQAVSFRRVLVRALERNATPFGLPKKLPKFIAMVQLCGERLLLTTERSQLFQLMAHSTQGARSNTDAINAMASIIKYRDENPECTLLLTYSAPFQVDLAHLWWDVRTLRRDPADPQGGRWRDGLPDRPGALPSHRCTSVLESETSSATLEKEVKAFEQNIGAVDLDMELVASARGEVVGDEATSKKVAALERVLASLTQERKKMIAEHKLEIEDLQAQKMAATSSANEAARHGIRAGARERAVAQPRDQPPGKGRGGVDCVRG